MVNIEVNTQKRADPAPYDRKPIPVSSVRSLPPPAPPSVSFLAALHERRSAEHIGPVPVEPLASWLYFVGSVQQRMRTDKNRQRRFVASFGALHPAHIIIKTATQWSAYLPETHELGAIEVDDSVGAQLALRAGAYFDGQQGTLIVLISDLDLANHYYSNAEPLVLRDGAILMGHGALVAAALGLAFRVLGGTEPQLARRLIPKLQFAAMPTGLAWIGTR